MRDTSVREKSEFSGNRFSSWFIGSTDSTSQNNKCYVTGKTVCDSGKNLKETQIIPKAITISCVLGMLYKELEVYLEFAQAKKKYSTIRCNITPECIRIHRLQATR